VPLITFVNGLWCFSLEWARRRALKTKAELQARHVAGHEDYLSDKVPPLPRPRFQVLVTPVPLEMGSDGAIQPAERRRHRRTNRKSTGHPLCGSDVFLGPEVFRLMREGLSREQAVGRVAFRLGWTMTRGRPVRYIMQKNAKERVYRSLRRYQSYCGGGNG
jgi:hypothetical protein